MVEYPKRKKNRLEKYDYSQNGAYFITICTDDRKCLLSRIVGGGVLDAPATHLSHYGTVVERRIQEMNRVYPDVQTVKYVIMPNHVHLLVCISRSGNRAGHGPSTAPAGACGEQPPKAALSERRTPAPTNAVIPHYVSTFKRLCNREFGKDIWQRSFHDHIIRDEAHYQLIWQYIDTNPARWQQDCFYTEE